MVFWRLGDLGAWTAATLGSGSLVTTANTDAEDSICPRGWKMPSYSGAYLNPGPDSWLNLLRETYGTAEYARYGSNRVGRWPINYLPTGYYYTDSGYIAKRIEYGRWWGMIGNGSDSGIYLNIQKNGPDEGIYQGYNSRGQGLAIRCVVRS